MCLIRRLSGEGDIRGGREADVAAEAVVPDERKRCPCPGDGVREPRRALGSGQGAFDRLERAVEAAADPALLGCGGLVAYFGHGKATDAARLVDRAGLLRRGVLLEAATVGWNVVEGVIALAAGSLAGSLALIAFGIDSFVETASGIVLWWRLRTELTGGNDPDRVERIERHAARTAGGILLALALYIVVDAGRRLLGFGVARVVLN